MNDIIKAACWRVSSAYAGMTSAALAQAITAPFALRAMSLLEFFAAIQAAGGNVSEFKAAWAYGDYLQRVEKVLAVGDLQGATALLAVIPITLTNTTAQAVQAVLAGATLRMVDVVALEQGEIIAPVSTSASDVDVALGR